MCTVQHVEKLQRQFTSEFTSELADELLSFQQLYFGTERPEPGKSPLSYLIYIVDNDLSDAFPQFEILVRLFLTLPIGIASAERSVSVLRRLKTYMRSTMGQQRLSDMALLAIEDKTAAKLKLDDVIKQFASAKARRGCHIE